jgi:group II intron reverse transcriptase/maturase
MQTANHVLQAIRKMGEKRIPLTRVYRSLFSEDLFLTAYAKIYRNQGALTPGTEDDTVDGMSLQRIRNIIEQLRLERFKFRPSRRIQTPKKSGGKRPLGIPNFTEKLVQEVLRMILEAYYEPRFRDSSHGFRPERGCHTALRFVKQKFTGATWLIEGDIRGCFDNIDHTKLMDILSRDIHDGRLLNLIRMSLQAGVVEDWQYHRTYSGTPQGGVLSPLLANIYLNELDEYVEEVLIPQHTRGDTRALNPAYRKVNNAVKRARRANNPTRINQLEQERRTLPAYDRLDPGYRRLHYVRYADDFILAFIGPKAEAEAIKASIGTFLREQLHLEMSSAKTLITHARTEQARFLGYAISIYQADHKLAQTKNAGIKGRSINGKVRLGIPRGLPDQLCQRYMHHNKAQSDSVLVVHSDAHIIDTYQQRFRGIAEYYKFAVDRGSLSKVRHVMEISLVKTLAHKFRIHVSQVYAKYRNQLDINGQNYKILSVDVPTRTGSHLVYWGTISLRVAPMGKETLNDNRYLEWWTVRSDLIQRLQANVCELCGSTENCQVHHIRKLADLSQQWAGRKDTPLWVKRMARIRRKTLVVCSKCHRAIHAAQTTPKRRE